MGDENQTSTEVQQTGAESQGQTAGTDAQGSSENQLEGVQRRIDQLTAKYRNAERTNEQLAQQNQELAAKLAELALQGRREPEIEIDPDRKKELDYILGPIQREIQSLKSRLAVQGVGQEVQAAARPGTPPEVLDHATKLFADWRRQGAPGTAQQALTFAMGEYVLNQGDEIRTVKTQAQKFNEGAGTVRSGASGGAARAPTKKELSEAELEQLSPEEQADYFQSRVDPNEAF